MIPAPFEYVRVGRRGHRRARSHEDAKLLAGGHSPPAMRLRLARPSTLVDIAISDLSYVREDGDGVAIGPSPATTTSRTARRSSRCVRSWRTRPSGIGDLQVRHMGTIGVRHGDPAGDSSVLLALDAEFTAQGRTARARIAAADFFTSLFDTALQDDEVHRDRRPEDRRRVELPEVQPRAQDWALVVAAVARTACASDSRTWDSRRCARPASRKR